MRFPSTHLLAVILAFSVQAFGQSVPPGAPAPHAADLPVVFVPNAPIQSSSGVQHRTVPLELQHEAKEFLDLSRSLQSDFESLNRGLLPKDTIEKLKRIEKLSKHLRSQIER